MFKCRHCNYLVFSTTCPSCGRSREDHREDQAVTGEVEYLPAVPVEASSHEPSLPQPFRKRLAGYLHCDESEVMVAQEPLRSTMPLWMLYPLDRVHGPKPWWMIRRILERIQRSVRN